MRYDGDMLALRYRPSPRAVFVLLMLLSVAASWMPPDWTNALKHVVQIVVPAQDTIYAICYRGSQSARQLRPAGSDGETETRALQHELASQAATIEQLRQEITDLRDLRAQHLPPGVPILPAKVVAWDSVAARDALLIERGSFRSVGWRDWVATRLFVAAGGEQGVNVGQAVLARESLLGRVEQVSPYMSRVQLLSDIDSPRIEVRIGDVSSEGQVTFVDYACSLRGAGQGRMLVEDVPYRFVQEGDDPEAASDQERIRVGSLVYSAPDQLGLPAPLVIGRVSRIEKDTKNRLVYNVTVEPEASRDQIREVFVIPLVPLGRMAVMP